MVTRSAPSAALTAWGLTPGVTQMRPDDTAPDGAVLIPLYARNGAIRGHTVVDASDAEFVNQWNWILSSWGYAQRGIRRDGKLQTFSLHRELLGLVAGDGIEGDHIDRNRLNYRRSNLRALPKKNGRPNSQNRSKQAGSKSSFRGVSFDPRYGNWRARVQVGGKSIHLGQFDTEAEAGEAARIGRARLMPYAVD